MAEAIVAALPPSAMITSTSLAGQFCMGGGCVGGWVVCMGLVCMCAISSPYLAGVQCGCVIRWGERTRETRECVCASAWPRIRYATTERHATRAPLMVERLIT